MFARVAVNVHVYCNACTFCSFIQILQHLQVEALIELGRPAVVLRLGLELAFLVAEVRPDHGDLHKGPEHAGRLPLQIAGSHD